MKEYDINLAKSLSGTEYFELAYIKDVIEENQEEAVRFYKKAFKKGKAEAGTNAGVCLMESGDIKDARCYFEKAWRTYSCKYSRLLLIFITLEKCSSKDTKKARPLLAELRQMADNCTDNVLRLQAELVAYYWHQQLCDMLTATGKQWLFDKMEKVGTRGLEASMEDVLRSDAYSKSLESVSVDTFIRNSVEKRESKKSRKQHQRKRRKRVWKHVKTGAYYTCLGLYYAGVVTLAILDALGQLDD